MEVNKAKNEKVKLDDEQKKHLVELNSIAAPRSEVLSFAWRCLLAGMAVELLPEPKGDHEKTYYPNGLLLGRRFTHWVEVVSLDKSFVGPDDYPNDTVRIGKVNDFHGKSMTQFGPPIAIAVMSLRTKGGCVICPLAGIDSFKRFEVREYADAKWYHLSKPVTSFQWLADTMNTAENHTTAIAQTMDTAKHGNDNGARAQQLLGILD